MNGRFTEKAETISLSQKVPLNFGHDYVEPNTCCSGS